MGLQSEAESRLLEGLRWYPEILLAVAFFFLLRYFTTRSTRLPTNWPVIGMLPGLLSNLHRIHDFATEVLADSGCTFLIKGPWLSGMDLLVTADPANINHVFNTNFPNYPKGSDFLEIFDVLGDGIFNADHDSWRAQRRMVHAVMAEKRFRRFSETTTRRKIQEGLLPLLDEAEAAASKDDGRAVVDLHDLFLRFAFDTTCMLVFGTDPGCLSAGLPAVEFADAVDTVEEVLLFRHVVPRPFWRLMRFLRVGEEARMARAWAVIDDFVYSSVAERREEICKTAEDGRGTGGQKKLASGTSDGEDKDSSASPDVLTSFLDGTGALEGKVPEGFNTRSNAFLRDTALNLMIAGRDTTAAALSWFFYLVSNHPKTEACIVRELRTLRAEHSHRGPVLFDPEELAPLVYLHAALLETLRLYPSVPFEHKGPIVPETLPSGHFAHPGLKVLVSLYAMGRMPGVWGADAAEFRPERWVNERGRLRHEPSYKFLSFNSGPRTCLGKDLAMNQMKAVASALIYNYEFRPVQGHRVEPKVSIILHMRYGLKLEVRRREAWPELNAPAVDSPAT